MGNQLYYGDNLDVLRKYIMDNSVDLVYLDPPFNSKQDYSVIFKNTKGQGSEAQIKAFNDTWHWGAISEHALLRDIPEHCSVKVIEATHAIVDLVGKNDLSAYMVMMIPRLVELRRVLKPEGSLFLHCDTTASHYLKIVLDAIFGLQNFRNEISWKRTSAHNDGKQGRKGLGRVRDILLFYSKSENFTWNVQYIPYSQDYIKDFYKYVELESGRRYRLGDLTGPGGESKGNPLYEVMGITRYWRYSREKMNELIAIGRIVQERPGLVPQYKRYLDEMPGVPLQDDWDDIGPIASQARERLGYPTQKPLALLERIIRLASNENDIVLDPFCGCGTAIHAAQKLERKWIGIDITSLAISLIKYRLTTAFPTIAFETIGEPQDVDGARQLALDDKHQFEWWSLSLVKAKPAKEGVEARQGRKGADGGKDGVIFFRDTGDRLNKVIISVKGGKNIGVDMVRSLGDVVDEQKAAIGVLLTLESPTKPMIDWAAQKGLFHSDVWGDFPKIQIITIADILAGKKISMPPTTVAETFATPRREQTKGVNEQQKLLE
jgi:DNA modification methylase